MGNRPVGDGKCVPQRVRRRWFATVDAAINGVRGPDEGTCLIEELI